MTEYKVMGKGGAAAPDEAADKTQVGLDKAKEVAVEKVAVAKEVTLLRKKKIFSLFM